MSETATALAMPPMGEIATALAKCQAELTNPPKTKTANAGKYTYRYADLAEIIDHVRPVMAKHGLAIVQMVTVIEERNFLVSRLLHTSGQYIESVYPLPRQAGSQEMGSAITYARRYSLCALLGIAAEEDDDGEKAQMAGTGGGKDERLRDELIEQMGQAALGNRAVMEYARGAGLHEGEENTVEALSVAAVETLLGNWDEAMAEMKKPTEKPKAKPKPEPEPDPDPDPEPEASGDLDGIDKRIATRIKKAGITPEQLKAYYVGAGHQPATVEPSKLPEKYITALLANWEKVASKIKEQQ